MRTCSLECKGKEAHSQADFLGLMMEEMEEDMVWEAEERVAIVVEEVVETVAAAVVVVVVEGEGTEVVKCNEYANPSSIFTTKIRSINSPGTWSSPRFHSIIVFSCHSIVHFSVLI
jgi:hypothetical protein